MNWIMMISFIVFFMLTALLYLDALGNYADSLLGGIWQIICCITTACFGGLILGGIVSGIIVFIGRTTLKHEEKVYQSYDLVTLDTNEDINGSFFLGCGYIGEDMYYHFYYKTQDGTQYDKIRATRCYIVETNEKPSYKIYGEFFKKTESIFYSDDIRFETKKVLYIPKNTIKNNYKVN